MTPASLKFLSTAKKEGQISKTTQVKDLGLSIERKEEKSQPGLPQIYSLGVVQQDEAEMSTFSKYFHLICFRRVH